MLDLDLFNIELFNIQDNGFYFGEDNYYYEGEELNINEPLFNIRLNSLLIPIYLCRDVDDYNFVEIPGTLFYLESEHEQYINEIINNSLLIEINNKIDLI